MERVGIIYASMTGNTEEIANVLYHVLRKNYAVELSDMELIGPEEVLTYDGILIGTYTDGDGDLPFEAEIFYDELDQLDLKDKLIGCFGSGDHMYPDFCAAADHFQRKVKQMHANVMDEVLKIELGPEEDDQRTACQTFAQAFSDRMKQRKTGKKLGA